MAELDTSGGGKNKGGKVRSKKQSTRVDLTAMVDLAFLLITFFMLTTTLAKPQAMDVAMPDKDDKDQQELTIADNRTMSILLGANNRVEWYMGLPDNPLTSPQVDNFGRNGIRKALIEQSKKVIAATGDPEKGLIVLIKPSDQSNYRNFVDILDEMKVSNITRYAIVEITIPDIGLLKRDGLYK
ncbi:biopolymer transporter ExbD [Daejeonella sp.]|uniref:ExbD/TolR family protein n=1 Tax=Daejeonella sp. TaxID=2805397 RepID=UPI0030C18E2B